MIHEGVTRKLLGKPTDHLTPEALMLNEKMMVDLNYERYNPKTKDPFSPIAFDAEENDFYHQWSIKQTGEYFGFHKLAELISAKDYLTLPSAFVDDFISAMGVGLNKRDKVEEEKAKQAAQKAGADPKQRDELKKAGIPDKLLKG